jgi:hypothetical protein
MFNKVAKTGDLNDEATGACRADYAAGKVRFGVA